ncbi:hypothetical protein [Desulfovibrio inopinatus]|uniref:hypothetical protein n=1 Tax=Desulfovibrio inopinatus TaxID=102109 RepID=UPI0003FE2C7C|nr:hypothetical protein [Desulfovibrio inopinatus]
MTKLGKVLEDTYADVAFAEENMDLQLHAKACCEKTAKGKSVGQWLEDTSAAAAFASASDHDTARSIVAEEDKIDNESPLIVVVGGATSFSYELVTYAIDMASRLKSSILALNLGSQKSDAFAAEFRKAAQAKDIPFSHLVCSGQRDQVVEALSRKYSNLQYVMSEPRPTARAIPVYCPAPSARTRPRPRARV